jgi:hypothetical protein
MLCLRGAIMAVKNVAEAIILQSIEDLWDKKCKEESVSFFKGEAFNACAEIAGLTASDRKKLLAMIGGLIHDKRKAEHVRGDKSGQYSFSGR